MLQHLLGNWQKRGTLGKLPLELIHELACKKLTSFKYYEYTPKIYIFLFFFTYLLIACSPKEFTFFYVCFYCIKLGQLCCIINTFGLKIKSI